jgi:hypothetical protein
MVLRVKVLLWVILLQCFLLMFPFLLVVTDSLSGAQGTGIQLLSGEESGGYQRQSVTIPLLLSLEEQI